MSTLERHRPAPGRTRPALTWATAAVATWAAAYGALRAHWAAGDAPAFAPLPHDLLAFTGWAPVALCAAAALAALALHRTRTSRTALAAAWTVAAALLLASPLLLLDLVGATLPGLGLDVHAPSALGRAGAATGAGLLATAAVAYRRRMRGACARCGQTTTYTRAAAPPRWAFAAAYLAVAGCLARLLSQFAFFSLDELPYEQGPAVIVFDVGFMLAGTVLPLALVHRWGLIWPGWVLGLARRRVPRWLVLGPAFAVAGALTVYFGFGLGQLAVSTVTGTAGGDAAFLWTSMSAYLVWGVALGAAAVPRLRQTRPPCRTCGA